MKIKTMLIKLNQVSIKNMGKVFYTLFALIIMQILTGLAVIFLEKGAAKILPFPGNMIFNFFMVFLAFQICLMLQYGFYVMLLRMTRKDYVTLGYLFYGFKNPRQSLPVNLLLSVFFGIILALSVFLSEKFLADRVINILAENSPEILKYNDVLFYLRLLVAFTLWSFISVVFMIPFIFTFAYRFDSPRESFIKAAGKSVRDIVKNGNYFRFIAFAIRAGGRYLLIAIAIKFMTALFASPEKKGLSLFSFILDFIYFLNIYTAFIRIYFSIPVMYESIVHPETFPEEEIKKTTIELPEAETEVKSQEESQSETQAGAENHQEGEKENEDSVNHEDQ